MSRRPNFEVTIELDAHKLRVVGFQTKSYPEIPASMSGPGAPAEGGELEDVEAFLVRGERERAIPDDMLRRLDLDDSIYRALERNQ